MVGLRDEDGVRCAFEAGEDVCAKVLYSVNFQGSDFLNESSGFCVYMARKVENVHLQGK